MYQPQRIQQMTPSSTFSQSAAARNTMGMVPGNQGVANKFTGNAADLNRNPQLPNTMAQGKQFALENASTGRNQSIAGMQGQARAMDSEINTRDSLTNNLFNRTTADIIEKTSGGGSIQLLSQNKDKIMSDLAATQAMSQELMKPTTLGQAAMNNGIGMA